MKRLTLGVGFISSGAYKARIDGQKTKGYITWQNMLKRCYCSKLHQKQPTYIGCSVSDDWLDYQNFAEWFYNHEYSDLGYQLDKDLLHAGNKIYSPEYCVFVPQELNKLLNDRKSARGDLPQGVYLDKHANRYKAQMRMYNKNVNLGRFKTPIEAYLVYKETKEEHVKVMANQWHNRIAQEVYKALIDWTLPDDPQQQYALHP